MPKATELEWLQWFYNHCDFGPAHGDVMVGLQQEFVAETGNDIPDGYEYE